ncbi:hypothetical protein ACF1BQ_030570 [Bradyrhizobium sp. RDT10]
MDGLKAQQLKINAALDVADYAAALRANKALQSAQMPQLVSMVESLWVRIGLF